MAKPRKLRCADLFCGASGAAMGLHQAGFEVICFDIKNQPHYPFEFNLKDALLERKPSQFLSHLQSLQPK